MIRPVADILPRESIRTVCSLNLSVNIQELGINHVMCVSGRNTDISHQFQSLRIEDIVACDDDRVEPDIRGEMLPQPLMVSQVVRVLEHQGSRIKVGHFYF